MPADKKIAIIYASGEINTESNGYGEQEIAEKPYVEALREVRADSSIKAVVLRVNSPGGSAQVSDNIWHEVELTKQVKPVVVSMGDYAASGGYYISCPASYIVASEYTLTGSIGVFGLSLNIQKLMNNKLGINNEVVKTNKFADVDALRLHLIDAYGGLTDAISVAAEMSGVETYSLVDYPKQEEGFEAMMKMLTDEVRSRLTIKELGEFAESARFIKSLVGSQGVQARLENVVEIYWCTVLDL